MLRKMKFEEFARVYDILDKSFNHDEIRSFEGQKKLFEDNAYGILVEENVKGMFGIWDFDDVRYIEHFAVEESERNGGFGGRLLDEYIKMENKSVILEVELPGEEITDRRIGFYKRHGFKFNEYDYIQPPMEEGKNPVPLRIMSYPTEITEDEFLRYKKELYKRVYKAEV